ncbi:MAG: leucine-rich repeat protein, partial [Clostridia bacterium]|nr:leucine-rich repeat protein [Clostridia bacterium]
LIIPANVTSIGHAAFHSINVQNIYVKRAEATENYDQGWHNRNTDDIIWNFKDFHTDALGITYVLFNDNTAHAISYSGNATEIIFSVEGFTVTKIGLRLFSSDASRTITKITLPDGLLVIESYALSALTSVKELFIPSSVTVIGTQAIGLSKDATIYLPQAVRPDEWDEKWTHTSVGAYDPLYHQIIWNFKAFYFDATYGITYVLRNDNTAIAVAFDGKVTEVVIGVEGYTVTALGKDLFKNRTALTKVTLPEGLTEIGDYAFYGCTRLKALNQPTTLQSIGSYAFTDCFGLVSLSFGAGLTEVGERAFSNCTGLTTISFETGLTTIGSYAFYHCTGLTSITLPDSVTTINSYAFEDCIKLLSIDLPEGLTTISYGCFQNCTALTSVSFPSGLKRIEDSAFNGCNKLATLALSVGLEYIGSNAFSNCSSLVRVDIPDGVTYIGSYAFQSCQQLTSVIIPESVATIEFYAFSDSANLMIFCRAVSRPTGWSASWKQSNITVIWNVKDSVVDEANGFTYAIRNDNTAVLVAYRGTATELTLGIEGYTLTEIGNGIFQDNTTLTSITVPEGVTSIGQYAFYGCTNLVTVNLPSTLKTIGEHAFYNCKKLAAIELPQNLTAIGQYAFYNCDALTEVNIPEGVTELSYHVFCDCEALKTVILPSTLITIRSYAFGSCINLPSIIIPESVTTVESEAFSNCQTITAFVRSLAKPSGWSSNWINSSRPVVWDFKELVVKDGVTYAVRNDGTAVVLSYSGTAEELTLGIEGVTVAEIARKAFYDNDTLKKIVIPEGVEVIGAYAFYSCSNLKEVSLPLTLKTIGNEAFAYSAIEQLVLKEHLIEIGDSTFSGCNLLIGVILPDGLQSLGSWAFSSCESLKYVFIPDTVTTMQEYAFGNDYNLTIYVEAVSQPSTWNTYWNGHNATVVYGVKGMKMDEQGVIYQLLEDNKASVVGFRFNGTDTDIVIGLDGYTVISIGRYAFSESSITSVVIPEGVETISSYAFYNCNALKSIQLPSTLRTIEGNAFENISNELTTLYIPANVTTIGFFAFTNFGHEITVYAEAASKPDGWVESWCPSLKEIVWGYVPTSEEQA